MMRLRLCLVSCALGLAGQAWGQTSAPALSGPAADNGSPHYNLSLPMFTAGSASPYDLSASTSAQASAPAPGAAAPPALPDTYTFDSFRQNIHGYVSAGVATHNGHEFSGGVEMPVVPGKVDLAFGANTGQVGGFTPVAPGAKPGTVTYNSYYASVHLHPADDIDAYIGVVGGHLGLHDMAVP